MSDYEESNNTKYGISNMSDEQFEVLIEASKRGALMRKYIEDALAKAKAEAPIDAFDFRATSWKWNEVNPDVANINIGFRVPMKGWQLKFWKFMEFYKRLCNL